MHRKHLLTSVQMARFVAHGSLRIDAVVPAEMNAEAIDVLQAGIPAVPYGTPLSEAFEEGSFAQRLVQLPEVAGAIHSLVGPGSDRRPPRGAHPEGARGRGPEPARRRDHRRAAGRVRRAAHVLPAGGHARDGRHPVACRAATCGAPTSPTPGGTRTCAARPGSSAPPARSSSCTTASGTAGGATTATSTATCSRSASTRPSGRCGSGTPTTCTTRPSPRSWATRFPWYENATGRLEIYNRVLLWRALIGDDTLRPGLLGHPRRPTGPTGWSRDAASTPTPPPRSRRRHDDDPAAGAGALPGLVRARLERSWAGRATTAPGETTPTTGDGDIPPYETGLDALKDGWRLFQAAQLLPPQPGHEYDVSFLKHEFFFEKLVSTGVR